MADTDATVRTQAQLLEIFRDGQPENSISAQDVRDFIASTPNTEVQATCQISSLVTQPVASADVAQVVALETEVFKEGITHSTVVNNEVLELQYDGVYEVTVNFSIFQGTGSGGILVVYLEETTGGSPQWVATQAATRRDGSNNQAGFAALQHLDRHSAGDQYRVMVIADNTNVALTAFQPGVGTHPAGYPAIPSVDVHIKKIAE